jgi:hypothetical protein
MTGQSATYLSTLPITFAGSVSAAGPEALSCEILRVPVRLLRAEVTELKGSA